MQLVKICYEIRYYLNKVFGTEMNNTFYESIIAGYYNTFKRKQTAINQKHKRKRKLIISLTTIPARIDKVWITIESLLRQTYKPDKIILWLARDEFENLPLPLKLKEQQKRGLQIRYCDNLKSYKKFYYAACENPNDYVVTTDDDIIYAENMLETLVRTYRENPGCIVCIRSHDIKVRGEKFAPYSSWGMYEERKYIDETPSFHNFLTGGAGALFPIFLMNRKFLDKNAFLRLAPYADDVWLNFWAWISDVRIVNAKGHLGYILSIESSSENGLTRMNVMYQRNDEQIEQVLKYFNIDIHKYL